MMEGDWAEREGRRKQMEILRRMIDLARDAETQKYSLLMDRGKRRKMIRANPAGPGTISVELQLDNRSTHFELTLVFCLFKS